MIPYANRQRNIARLALQAAGAHSGFALAGSGAICEHGLIDRPTEDVDPRSCRCGSTITAI